MVSLVIWLVGATALLSGGVALLAYRQHPQPGARTFALGMTGIAWWLASMFLGYSLQPTVDPRISSLFFRLEGLGASLMAICWFVFSMEYTGRSEYVTRRLIVGLAGFVVVSLPIGLGATPLLELYASWVGWSLSLPYVDLWSVWQPVGFVYLFVLIVAGFALILGLVVNQRLPRPELGALWLLAVFVPLVVGLLHISGVFNPFGVVDPTPFGFVVTGLVGLVAISRYDIFQSAPIARDYVVDRVQAGMLVADSQFRLVDYNDWAADLFELEEDALGHDVGAVLAAQAAGSIPTVEDEPEYVSRLDGITLEVSTHGTDNFEGPIRHLLVDMTPLERPDGHRHGYSILLYDTTEKRRYREQLEQKNEQLERLADVVSHDIRNPLDVGIDQARRLKRQLDGDDRGATDQPISEQLDRIEETMVRSVDIVEDMLAVARSGRALQEPEEIDVVDVAWLAWSYVDTGSLELVADDSGTVVADRQRLSQLFENLYRNTVVHGDGATLVRVETTLDGFAVEDDGCGIDPDRREEVMKAGETTVPAGTGLGLSIVREIVTAHGWDVTVTEGSGGGARFEVSDVGTE